MSIRSRTAPLSASARTFVPITSSSESTGPYSLDVGGCQRTSFRTSTSHCWPVPGVCGEETAGKRPDLDLFDLPATFCEPVAHGADNLADRCRVLGGYVDVLGEAVDQAVSLDCVPAGDHQGVWVSDVEDVGQEATVQFGEVHAAVVASAAGRSGKRFSQASRRGRLISVRRMGHWAMSRSRLRKAIRSWRCPSASTVR